MADESDQELERLDPESEACYAALRDRISEELAARIAIGDDPMTREGQQGLSELIADAILDGFAVKARTSPRYRWRRA
jgi:hypothetical protein